MGSILIRTRMIALCLVAVSAVTHADEKIRPVLKLHTGDQIAGTLLASDDPTIVAWQGDGFVRPFRFPIASVHSLRNTVAEDNDPPNAYRFELAGGDILDGELLSLSDREVVLKNSALGSVTLERAAVLRFYRLDGADLVYSGPRGLDGWSASENEWRDDSGQLRTDVVGAWIGRTDRPPERVRYDIELAWSSKPDFVFAAGLSRHHPGQTAFRLETWGDELVITRETDQQANVASLQKIAPGAGTMMLSVFFDEAQGRVIAFSAQGKALADFSVPPSDPSATKPKPKQRIVNAVPAADSKPAPPSGLKLTHLKGQLSLQRLTLRRWDGEAPQPVDENHASILLREGKTQPAEIRSFDQDTRRLEVVIEGETRKLDEASLRQVVLRTRDEAGPELASFFLNDGARLTGEIQVFGADAVTIRAPAAREPLTIPHRRLQSIIFRQPNQKVVKSAVEKIRLEMPGVSLHGSLQGTPQPDESCLVFQPIDSTTASPLSANASGKFIFRETPPVAQPAGQKPQVNSAVGQFVTEWKTFWGAGAKNAPPNPNQQGDCLLHLRSGDTIPCQVRFIDERGVTFTSTFTKAVFVSHERIKVVELRLNAPPVKIEKTRFERLLTLPRMQRINPPEHLIRSLEGDYLRGRLISMNEKELEIEVRSESRKIARDQVSRILWLHPDEVSKALVAKPAETPPPEKIPGFRVQAVPRNGHRLTFFAQELREKSLLGRSELLGECEVGFAQIDRLLFGREIENDQPMLVFHQWHLRAASDPLPDPEAGDGPNNNEGLESVLVGKPAPAIELDLLTGGKFRLSDYKDQVVVLDFWASWCGPCMRTMPQIEKVTEEFSERGVKLVGINLGETPDQIKTVLARLKLKVNVALDAEGRIAERYGASDIPQTVIIGRNGKVARLFVGAGARFDEKLRLAINAVLAE